MDSASLFRSLAKKCKHFFAFVHCTGEAERNHLRVYSQDDEEAEERSETERYHFCLGKSLVRSVSIK